MKIGNDFFPSSAQSRLKKFSNFPSKSSRLRHARRREDETVSNENVPFFEKDFNVLSLDFIFIKINE